MTSLCIYMTIKLYLEYFEQLIYTIANQFVLKYIKLFDETLIANNINAQLNFLAILKQNYHIAT